MRFFQNTSIRRKQTLITMLTSSVALLLACAVFISFEAISFRKDMAQNLSALAKIIGKNTSAALDFNDPQSAEETLFALKAQPNIIDACIFSRNGDVFAKYDRPDDNIIFTPPPKSQSEGYSFGKNNLTLFEPIISKGDVIGTIYLESDMRALYAELDRYAVITAIVFVLTLCAAFLLSSQLQRLVSDPILHLAQAARTVAQEKNYSLRVKKQSDDEIGQLVDGFNEMLAQIQTRDAALQAAREDLGRRVGERTKELAESQSLYRSLVDQMPAGVFRKDADGRFVFVNSWYCRNKEMEPDQILGRTAAELAASERQNPKAKWRQDMAVQGTAHHELIMQTGQPVEAEEQYPDTGGRVQHLRVVKSPVIDADGKVVGSQGMVFDITERKQAEAELSHERDLLRALLDFSPDPIYFKDAQSRFLKASKIHAEIFGLKDVSEMLGKTDFDYFTEAHARPAFEDEQEIIRTGVPLVGKAEKEVWKNGRITWVLTNKMPLRNKDGQIIGTFGISKDITAMKEAEIQLEEVNKQSRETARLAGMAEIATNVLHNVGNVLNSVNVSASVVIGSVRKSKAASLAKVVTLLREHEKDLGTFFTSDPRGKQLPAYLGQLSGQLLADQKTAIEELSSLLKNIEHIMDIVTMQQTYARVSGVKEIINLRELVEDSLRMNVGALGQHGVEVIREFADVPPVNIDRHKVLQVLVNLLRNAKHACQDSERADKQLTVRVANGDDRIKISVSDNGVGIPPENLTRIFSHGFTTRKDGHGFGLHSGALAAKEMGGALIAHSDGVGQGATFTLELPVHPESATEGDKK